MKPFALLTPADHGAHAAGAARGHRMAPDHRGGGMAADGWACEACGRRLWFDGTWTGPATVEECPPDIGPYDAHLPHVARRLEGGPPIPLDPRLLAAAGVQMLDGSRSADEEATIHVLPWDEALQGFMAGISAGAAMFQRFVCDACGAIQTMPVPNHVYAIGRCEECAHLTDLQIRGFGAMGLAPREGADRDEFATLLAAVSNEVRATPDNFVQRHRGIEVKSKPRLAPCPNCGRPFHAGKPCDIRARAAAKRGKR